MNLCAHVVSALWYIGLQCKNTETEVSSSDDTYIIYKFKEDLFLIQRTLFKSTLYLSEHSDFSK